MGKKKKLNKINSLGEREKILLMRELREIIENAIDKVSRKLIFKDITIEQAEAYKIAFNNRYREILKNSMRDFYKELENDQEIFRRINKLTYLSDLEAYNEKTLIIKDIKSRVESYILEVNPKISEKLTDRFNKLIDLNREFRTWYQNNGEIFLTEASSQLFLDDYVLLKDKDYQSKVSTARNVMRLVNDILRANNNRGLERILTKKDISFAISSSKQLGMYIKEEVLKNYLQFVNNESKKLLNTKRRNSLESIAITESIDSQTIVYELVNSTPYHNFICLLNDRKPNREEVLDYLLLNQDDLYSQREDILRDLSNKKYVFDEYIHGGTIQRVERRGLAREWNLPHNSWSSYRKNTTIEDERNYNKVERLRILKVNRKRKQKVATN